MSTIKRGAPRTSGLRAQTWSRMETEPCLRIPIREEVDVAMARLSVRQLAPQAGLSDSAAHSLMTAVSEIAWNIVIHAGNGELTMGVIERDGRRGMTVAARDTGPGIPDAERAMEDGYSSANGLGLGLSSARRLVDDFDLVTDADHGTTVTLTKWTS